MVFYSILDRICKKMGKYKITRLFYSFLMKIGLIHFCHFLFNIWFQLKPTQKMKDERKFFSDHAKELEEVYNSLEDDESRLVFENILKFRTTSKQKYLRRARRGGIDNLKTQYLVPELQFSGGEIIVDCGAFDGDTVKTFYRTIPGCRVIAIEPDKRNYEHLRLLLSQYESLKIEKCGAWSEDTVLTFSDGGGGATNGKVSACGNVQIEAKALDHLPECQSATYIKMDIEGAELEALKGCENIIKKNKPKLAICIYHHPQDFFELPLYIKRLNPDYKFYIHHHSYCTAETVLYAI